MDAPDSQDNPPSIESVKHLLRNLIAKSKSNNSRPPAFFKVKGESRPYANLTILQQPFPSLIDSGAHRNVCGNVGGKRLIALGFKFKKVTERHDPAINTADNTIHLINYAFSIPIQFDGMSSIIQVLYAPTLPQDLILGITFMRSFQMGIFTPNSVWFPDHEESIDYHVNVLNELKSIELDPLEEEQIELQRDLTEEQRKLLEAVDEKLKFLGSILLGRTNVIEHDIDTGDNAPSFTGTRPMSPAKEKKVEEEFLRFKSLGVVEPAQTAFRNAMTMVEKYKVGKLKLRLCLDSRKLNAITKVEKYDLPRINTILTRLGTAKYISKIDLKDAYLQIPLTERSKEKTAFFVKGHGVWQFITMPFGLVNCSATMQKLMDRLFGDLEGMVFVYQDDLVIVNDDFESHLQALHLVADKLKSAGLSINYAKSGLCLRNMRYMGYIVDELGLRPDPEKVECVLKIPLPQTVTDLRRFVGMAGWYRRFIETFSIVTAPLYDLLKGGGKGRKLIWNELAIKSFEQLKHLLVTAPLLQSPDFTKPFFITCDASGGCIGGVLSQNSDDPKYDRPIAYISRRLRGPELHYSNTERECLAVVFCVEKFLEFVEGTEFTVLTDHSALTWLFKQKDLSGRLARWVMSLQHHYMKIKHIKGKNNVVADALSRFPIVQILSYVNLLNFVQPTGDAWYEDLVEQVRLGNSRCRRYKEIKGKLYYDPSIKGRRLSNYRWKLVVPSNGRLSVLDECHDDPKSAHFGVQKTIDKIMDRYYWPGLSKDVKDYIRSCDVCKMSKHDNMKPPGLMGKYRIAKHPWQMVSMDLLGPFPRSKNGNTVLLVVSDWFSKYPCLIPLRNGTAKNIVKNVENRIFTEYSVPQIVIMDNGSQFSRSNEIKSLLKRYGIERLWSNCIYHAQSNFTERHNKNLNAALRAYIRENHKDWDKHLPQISVALKTAVNSITGYSPFFLNHAREFVFHADDYKLLEANADNETEPVKHRTDFINKFREVSKDIMKKMQKSYDRNKRYYDKFRAELEFNVGDKVFIKNHVKSDASKSFNKKLAPVYVTGKILSKLSKVAYFVSDDSGNNERKVHVQDLRPRIARSPRLINPPNN